MSKRKPTVRKVIPAASVSEHVRRIQSFDRAQLIALWDSIEAGKAKDWPAGKAFEMTVLRAFELEKARVQWPYLVTIQDVVVEEIDGFVETQELSFMVESKDLGDAVGIGPVAKLRNQLARRPGGLLGCIFSRSGFTPPAVLLSTYCAPQAILLWSGSEIGDALRSDAGMTEALYQKYQWLLRMGLPDWEYTRKSS